MTCARGEGQNLRTVFPSHPAQSASRPTEPTSCRPVNTNPAPPSRHGAPPSRSRNDRSGGISATANIPSGIERPSGFADTAPPTRSTASLQHGPTRSCGSNGLGRPNTQAPARPTHADGRAWIAGHQSPWRRDRGVDPGTPATPNPQGVPLTMAATCRPVLRRPNGLSLVPNSAPRHPSADAIHSPSIPGDSDAEVTLSSAGLPGRGRERSLTPKGHTFRGGGRSALCSETS